MKILRVALFLPRAGACNYLQVELLNRIIEERQKGVRTAREGAGARQGAQKEDENGVSYLHRGIARRSFERRFSLADHMKVVGASLDNGMLSVDVVHEVPEAAKPRTSRSALRSRLCNLR